MDKKRKLSFGGLISITLFYLLWITRARDCKLREINRDIKKGKMRKLSATGGRINAVSRYSLYCRLLVPIYIYIFSYSFRKMIV